MENQRFIVSDHVFGFCAKKITFPRRFTYRSLGSNSNSHERSIQHRNFVKILRFLSLVCETSRREETFSLRSNVMVGNTMHSLVDSISSSMDQQLPMDALNCVRLSLECWPRIDNIIGKLKQSYEPCVNASVPSPKVFNFPYRCFDIFDVLTGRITGGLARAFSLDFSLLQFHVCTSNCVSG